MGNGAFGKASAGGGPREKGARQPQRRSPLMRGLQVLDHLQGRPSTASEIAAALSVDRSTAHRLLRGLESAGYITREDRTRRFLLSSSKFSPVGAHAAHPLPTAPDREVDWHEVLHRVLGQIRDVVGESTMFSVPARDQMLHVAFFATAHPIGVQESVGSTRPIHASAVGKAYLSALPPGDLDVVLGRLVYSTGTGRAAKGPVPVARHVGRGRNSRVRRRPRRDISRLKLRRNTGPRRWGACGGRWRHGPDTSLLGRATSVVRRTLGTEGALPSHVVIGPAQRTATPAGDPQMTTSSVLGVARVGTQRSPIPGQDTLGTSFGQHHYG